MIASRHDAPPVVSRITDAVVFHSIGQAGNNDKIKKPLIHFLGYLFGHAAYDMAAESGIFLAECKKLPGEDIHMTGFRSSHMDIPADDVFQILEFLFSLVHQGNDVLGSFLEQETFFCKP